MPIACKNYFFNSDVGAQNLLGYGLLRMDYCIHGYFRRGFIFTNFASQSSQKFPLQYMAIYSNGNINKIANLSPRKLFQPSPISRKYLYAKYMVYTIY